jgi:hypothetical protein
MSKRILSVAFKAYHQQQGMLLPPSPDELIGQDHPGKNRKPGAR